MDKKDLAAQAERYKREMMKLYGKAPEAVPAVNTRPETETLPEVPAEADSNITTKPLTEPEITEEPESAAEQMTEPEMKEEQENEQTLEERYPEPDLSELELSAGSQPEPEPEPITAKNLLDEEVMGTSTGYILVNVRTGDDAEPVVNASVKITTIAAGSRLLLASGVTDESGKTPRFELIVPDVSYSLTPDSGILPYGLFDISVTAEGFFNARSVDVPVFSGITSVQNFSMIPLPLFMKAGDETVTYFNQEPNL